MLLSRYLITMTCPEACLQPVDHSAESAVAFVASQFQSSSASFMQSELVENGSSDTAVLSYVLPPAGGGAAIEIKWSGHAEEMEAVIAFAFALSPLHSAYRLAVACGCARADERVLVRSGGEKLADTVTPVVAMAVLVRTVRESSDSAVILRQADRGSVTYAVCPRQGAAGSGVAITHTGRPEDVAPLTILIKLLSGDSTAISAFVDACRAQHRLRAAARYVR